MKLNEHCDQPGVRISTGQISHCQETIIDKWS